MPSISASSPRSRSTASGRSSPSIASASCGDEHRGSGALGQLLEGQTERQRRVGGGQPALKLSAQLGLSVGDRVAGATRAARAQPAAEPAATSNAVG
jgi:hypothetical protein